MKAREASRYCPEARAAWPAVRWGAASSGEAETAEAAAARTERARGSRRMVLRVMVQGTGGVAAADKDVTWRTNEKDPSSTSLSFG